MDLRFKVRPFDQVIDYPNSPRAWRAGATIEGDSYVFTFAGARFPISVIRSGEDERGAYAIIAAQMAELGYGFRLEVGADVVMAEDSPEAPLGCTIRLFRPSDEYDRITAESPGWVMVLPVAASVSVDFNSDGRVNGWAGPVFKTDYPPGAPPPPTKH